MLSTNFITSSVSMVKIVFLNSLISLLEDFTSFTFTHTVTHSIVHDKKTTELITDLQNFRNTNDLWDEFSRRKATQSLRDDNDTANSFMASKIKQSQFLFEGVRRLSER